MPIPTTPPPRRSTATSTNLEEQEGPSTVGSRMRNEDSVTLFGESPSKKGSSSVKYGGKKKSGGPLGGPGSSPSANRAPDSRRESLSARLGIGRDTNGIVSPISTSKRKNVTSNGSQKRPKSSPPASVSTPASTSQKSKNMKRNRVSILISTDDEQGQNMSGSELSELTTPPSSPVRMTVKRRREQQPTSSKISSISVSSPSLPSSPQKPVSKGRKSTFRKPNPLSKSASWASSTVNGSMTEIPDTWSLEQLGNHVWVMLGLGLLDGRVLVYQSPENDQQRQEDEVQWCWWPAKLRRSKAADKDILILTPYSHSISPNTRDLHLPVTNASSSNILSFSNKIEHVRFEKLTFLSPSSHNVAVQRSPKKKRKLEKSEFEAQFDQALAQALEDEESLDDGVPSLYNALSHGGSFSMTNGSRFKKGERRETVKDSISDDGEAVNGNEGEWEETVDAGTDELLDIPGERVLCRGMKNPSTEYWPAKVIAYVPPPSRIKKKGRGKNQESGAGKYRVVFLDELEMEVPRDWFYASHEDGFGRCKLGKFQSEFVDNPNDTGDDEDSYSDYDFEAEYDSVSQGSSSQEPGSFSSLSLSTQFIHVIPVLRAILSDRYPPTRDRHEQFMKGGKPRNSLTMEAEGGLRGRMNPKDADVFAKLVQGWCLGSSRKDINAEEAIGGETVHVIDVESGEQSGPKTDVNGDGEVSGTQTNGVRGKSPDDASNADQVLKDDTPMILDVGVPSTTTITNPEPPTTTANDPDVHMDILDEESSKENVSPHLTIPMETETKPQSGAVTDIQVEGPVEVEAPMPTTPSVTTPPIELELNDRPGLALPLPLLIMHAAAASQVTEEQSPLTPLPEPITSAPPTVFEGNGESSRRKRERQTGCESYEALGGVEKVNYTLTILFPIVIRQMLLWRDGSRTVSGQLQVLSDEEEWELHRKAEELVRETDWVFDVRRLRETVEKKIQREEGLKNVTGRAGRVSRKVRKTN